MKIIMYSYTSYVKYFWGLLALGFIAVVGMLGFYQFLPSSAPSFTAQSVKYPAHQVTATMFYVGEPGDSDNANISNTSSAWDEQWRDRKSVV